jgi:hypothetical protein
MQTYLAERRAAPGDQSASIVFLISALVMLQMVALLSAIALSRMDLPFGSDGNIAAILS